MSQIMPAACPAGSGPHLLPNPFDQQLRITPHPPAPHQCRGILVREPAQGAPRRGRAQRGSASAPGMGYAFLRWWEICPVVGAGRAAERA